MKKRSVWFIGMMVAGLFLSKIAFSTFLFPGFLGSISAPDTALAQNQPVAPATAAAKTGPELGSPEAMNEKERTLKEWELKLKQQEAELVPLKKEIEEKLAELNELQASLAAYAKKLAEREKALQDAKMNHLVEVYSTMEPVNAAAIMEKLKIETVVQILRYMKGKPAGLILAQMKPDIGAQISERLSHTD